jgi:hypothetical protein
LHAQASLWDNHHGRQVPVLFMEGEAADRTNGGGMLPDALYRVALARGLRFTTDLDHLDPRPVHGWRLRVDGDRSLTLEWPHFRPLLNHIPLDLPNGWMTAAAESGQAILFVGYGLGMRSVNGNGHTAEHLGHAAETGALASGIVPVLTDA